MDEICENCKWWRRQPFRSDHPNIIGKCDEPNSDDPDMDCLGSDACLDFEAQATTSSKDDGA